MSPDGNKNRQRARPRAEEPKPDAEGVGPGAYDNVYDEQNHAHGTPGEPELANPNRRGPRHDLAQGGQTHETEDED